MTWIKHKLRPLLFKGWRWTYDDNDDDGSVYYDSHGNREVCPGADCNDPSCPGWG
jgi:hypothetical protein